MHTTASLYSQTIVSGSVYLLFAPRVHQSHHCTYMQSQNLRDHEATEIEMDRRAHVGHEISIQGIGCLFVGAGLPLLIGAGIGFANHLITGNFQEIGIGLVGLLFAIFIFWSGAGLQRLLFTHAVAASLILIVVLIAFIPVVWSDMQFLPCVLLPAYMLWLLMGRRGRRVLSSDYRTLIEITPHVRQLSSPWLLALLIMLSLTIMIWYIQNSGFAEMATPPPEAAQER